MRLDPGEFGFDAGETLGEHAERRRIVRRLHALEHAFDRGGQAIDSPRRRHLGLQIRERLRRRIFFALAPVLLRHRA